MTRTGVLAAVVLLCAALAGCQTAGPVAVHPVGAPVIGGLDSDGRCVGRLVGAYDPSTGEIGAARQSFCGGRAVVAE